MTHTKIISAKIDGVPLQKAGWNRLLVGLLQRAKAHMSDGDDAQQLIIVNFVRGKKEDDRYSFIPEIDLSIQGQTSNSAWIGSYHIARQLGIPIEAVFLERNKEGVKFPGVIGRLWYSPSTV